MKYTMDFNEKWLFGISIKEKHYLFIFGSPWVISLWDYEIQCLICIKIIIYMETVIVAEIRKINQYLKQKSYIHMKLNVNAIDH